MESPALLLDDLRLEVFAYQNEYFYTHDVQVLDLTDTTYQSASLEHPEGVDDLGPCSIGEVYDGGDFLYFHLIRAGIVNPLDPEQLRADIDYLLMLAEEADEEFVPGGQNDNEQ